MALLGSFDFNADKPNILATTIYRRMLSGAYKPNDTIYLTVCIGSETADKIVDFTTQDLAYICKQILRPVYTNGL